MNLSLLIGIRNNLPYTKFFYSTTRRLYPDIEIVFVSYGSTDGTHEWLDQLSDENLKYFYSQENKTLSDTYNKCIELASKEYLALLHNDMVLGEGFAEHLIKEFAEDRVLFYKVVEPPIFSEDTHNWKVIKDFGQDFSSFDIDAFRKFAGRSENRIEATADLSFFLAAPKAVLIKMNGLDPIFNPMFREDDDLLYRLQLLGLKMFQSHNAMVYHFVSKTSRFSEEYVNKTKEIEEKSTRNFHRKWGFNIHAEVKEKRAYGLVLKNADAHSLELLEPLVSKIYTTANIDSYISREQPNTTVDLSKKFESPAAQKKEDILIFFDTKDLSSRNIRKFETLSALIKKKLASPWFKLKKRLFLGQSFKTGGLRIKINRSKTYERDLIIRK